MKNPVCRTCGNYFHCDNCGLGTTTLNEHYRKEHAWSTEPTWACAALDTTYDEDGKPLSWASPDADPLSDLFSLGPDEAERLAQRILGRHRV